MSNIPFLIKEIRRKNKLGQEQLAKSLGVTTNYISLIENGRKKPGLKFLKKVSDEFKYPLIVLLQEEDLLPKPKSHKEREIHRKLNFLLEDLKKVALS
jgi:transcriptional regulator with XRE-family HTH domain